MDHQELLEELDLRIKEDENLETLDLAAKVTEFSEDVVEKLHEFEKLKKLVLSNNSFNELPTNLDLLDNVEELYLVNVEFDDLSMTHAALNKMPRLRILEINLEDPEDVEDTL